MGVLLPSHRQPEDDTGAGGGHVKENRRDHGIKPVLKLPAGGPRCPIVPTSLSKDVCTSSKAGSWAPSPSPNRVTPQSMPSPGAWLQTRLSYPGCLASGGRLSAFCHQGRSDQQSQCQRDGGLSHCLSDGLVLPQ